MAAQRAAFFHGAVSGGAEGEREGEGGGGGGGWGKRWGGRERRGRREPGQSADVRLKLQSQEAPHISPVSGLPPTSKHGPHIPRERHLNKKREREGDRKKEFIFPQDSALEFVTHTYIQHTVGNRPFVKSQSTP